MSSADTPRGIRPFWAATPARTVRRGHFWVPGERVERDGKTYQRGPMFAEWEAAAEVTRPHPIVLVHGGGLQGTEWLDTPDGRPGWAQRLVEAGYATPSGWLAADRRPGLVRAIVSVEPMGPPFADIPNIGALRWGLAASP